MSEIQCKISLGAQKFLQLSTILLVFSPIMSGYNWNNSRGGKIVTDTNLLQSTPHFDENTTSREIQATVGQTLVLPCIIHDLKDKVVSWIRTRDLHILTSGKLTFSSDNRFESVHSASSGDFWGLRIRGVQLSDIGQYECQINTDPKMSLAIKLNVLTHVEKFVSNTEWVSRALIMGPNHVFVQNGKKHTFTCIISPLFMPSSSAHKFFFNTKRPVRWLHNGEEIFVERNRNGVTIETVYGETDLRITSKLHLEPVTWKDSGQYTCMQPSTKPDTIKLTVVEGEHSEAMQRDFPIPLPSNANQTTIFVNVINYFLLLIVICIK